VAQGHARPGGAGSLRGPQLSLLLDALKRAEREKLARQPDTPGAVPPARAVAVAPPAAGPSLELQPIAGGGGAAPHGAHAAHGAPGARADGAAHAAQNVFQAKVADSDAPRSRTVLWTTFGAIAFVAIAAAAYVWYSVKSLTPQYAGAPRPRAAPTPLPDSGAPLPPTAAMGSIVPAPGAVVPAQVAPEAPPAAAVPAAAPKAPPPAPSVAERLERAAADVRTPPPLQMDRSAQSARRVPAQVAEGYEGLHRGDFAAARRGYAAALASDPTSADAHLGMATIEARSANRAVATEHYRRVLELDPRNATALAGLAALADFSRPEALEAQLQADLARLPESSALQFTLGNLYAAQARWSEAQAAYFEAHRLDPGSAEIAHNLAVSLDHVGQRRLAAGFYRRALEGARGRVPPFDAAAVARRLAELD
jgi:Tfp pilus assembly protein PilF